MNLQLLKVMTMMMRRKNKRRRKRRRNEDGLQRGMSGIAQRMLKGVLFISIFTCARQDILKKRLCCPYITSMDRRAYEGNEQNRRKEAQEFYLCSLSRMYRKESNNK